MMTRILINLSRKQKKRTKLSNFEQIRTRFSASEVADYALVDFNGEKIWIYGSLENPALLIPHYEKTAAEMFR